MFHVITDGDHKAPPQTDDGGVPFLVISNVRNGTLNFHNTRQVRADSAIQAILSGEET